MFAGRRPTALWTTLAGVSALALPLVPAGCAHADVSSARVPRIVRPVFDRDAAFRLLAKQCDFGPRVPGTDGHDKTRAFLVAELSRFTARVQRQDFRYRGITMTNIIAAFGPAGPPRVLLCAHWDTRPTADMEVDEAKRAMPIPGANDGASGVAVLLELARGFKQQAPPVGVVIALLDGEDFGDFRRDEGVLLGAKHLARNQAPLGGTPRVGILLDMVGGRDLLIRREANSDRYARAVNDLVFQTARDLGYGERFVEDPITITDDHVPLNQAGIPTIDLIDFNYGPWHTLDDTPDKCSAESLGIIGNVVAEVVYRQK